MRIVKFSLALAAAVAVSLGASPALADTGAGTLEDRWEKTGPGAAVSVTVDVPSGPGEKGPATVTVKVDTPADRWEK
ncbi:hypothetical protein ABZ249_05310 [Nocardiopsis sp. NPDC006139]|uniref:hypothetical protein n=1 Tax=Nocardiopsis TaxID=2013 RepID=UPI001598987F|nr:hypothetical protein HUT17_01855 [Nocardiopsis flavescens]